MAQKKKKAGGVPLSAYARGHAQGLADGKADLVPRLPAHGEQDYKDKEYQRGYDAGYREGKKSGRTS